MKPSREDEKAMKAHEILHEFRYNIHEQWVDQAWINKHDRLWISVFNTLVKQGLIEKKKVKTEYKYRWIAEMPRIY
ncbi:MAG: hypothetical protein KJ574_05265 [Nanoarchaeota archaeon]|nr:hypothetical protein [Nanoarchaeota archaeon]